MFLSKYGGRILRNVKPLYPPKPSRAFRAHVPYTCRILQYQRIAWNTTQGHEPASPPIRKIQDRPENLRNVGQEEDQRNENPNSRRRSSFLSHLFNNFYYIILSRTIKILLTIHLFWNYVGNAYFCYGVSMLPTMSVTSTCVIQSKFHRRGRGIKVGDVISIITPNAPDVYMCKRVIGMPGDYVIVDPTVVDENGEVSMVKVPEGHCWVSGDNLTHSVDSRFHGMIPLALVSAKAVCQIVGHWPFLEPFEGLKPVN